jgi:uncharacterized protein (TIGR03435 family)
MLTRAHIVLVGTLAATALVPGASAQTPAPSEKPSFEIASVKANKSGDGRMMFGLQPGGGMTATNVPLRELIRFAYEVQDFQIVGAPGWTESERFDVVAKAVVDRPADAQIALPGPRERQMMQSLLADRFKLTLHNDTRPLPIYALVLARSDGKLGPQLKPSAADCAAIRGRGPGGPGGPAGRGPMGPPAPGERPQCGMMMRPGGIVAGGMPLADFIRTLSMFLRRVVVDRTNLQGNYDIDLTWTPDQMPPGPPPPGVQLPPIDPNGPSIFTAVQEQLGLKLESQTGPVDVLVIDRVERPSEN